MLNLNEISDGPTMNLLSIIQIALADVYAIYYNSCKTTVTTQLCRVHPGLWSDYITTTTSFQA